VPQRAHAGLLRNGGESQAARCTPLTDVMIMRDTGRSRTLRALLGTPALTASLAFAAVVWAQTAAAANVYYVAQQHPAASNENPGTADQPFKSISRAATQVKPGDRVVIEDGVYRECVRVETSGTADQPIIFEAAPMANVVVTGAEQITEWQREEGEENVFSTSWPHEFVSWSTRHAHPDDDYHLMIGRAEQIHVDNYPLVQVLSRDKLSRGTFYVDLAGKRLYIQDRTGMDILKQRAVVEASVRQQLFVCQASYVHVKGLRFRFAANQAQMGAVSLEGDYNLLEDCVAEHMNSTGAVFVGTGVTARRCVFRHNGWTGFDVGLGHDFLMTECVCENNNTKNWNRGWGAVNKLVLCRKAVIEKSIFRDNRGNGLWFDIGNEDCEVRNCLIINNEDAGLFYEISYGLHAHDNVIIGNGLAPRFGAWGANGGIALSSSPYCIVERNLLIGNKEGFQLREQFRTTNTIGDPANKQYSVWNHDNVIRNNVLAYNRDAQTAAWIATGDGRLWPRALWETVLGRPAPTANNLPQDGSLDRLVQGPEGMTLEDLKLTFAGNLYAVKPGQTLHQWGCLWDPHRRYATLAEVTEALNLEQGSSVADITFADWATLDLRAPAESPLLRMGCYPQGEVPGVKLGVLPPRR